MLMEPKISSWQTTPIMQGQIIVGSALNLITAAGKA
jgi:hypothetical protein